MEVVLVKIKYFTTIILASTFLGTFYPDHLTRTFSWVVTPLPTTTRDQNFQTSTAVKNKSRLVRNRGHRGAVG